MLVVLKHMSTYRPYSEEREHSPNSDYWHGYSSSDEFSDPSSDQVPALRKVINRYNASGERYNIRREAPGFEIIPDQQPKSDSLDGLCCESEDINGSVSRAQSEK